MKAELLPDELVEYRYRRVMGGLTHEQFLDEDAETVDWMLALDSVFKRGGH